MGISPSLLLDIYQRMKKHFGPPGWWPGDSPFEVMVGAILTQNTSWKNVETAIENLKKSDLLYPKAIAELPIEKLEQLIKPSGFFRQKARRLKEFCRYLTERYGGDTELMKRQDMWSLREELLSLKGIGKETADSILLYALEKPIFVVDAYTHRIMNRHGLAPDEVSYDELQSIFMDNLPKDVKLFNEFHALFVLTGKDFCRKKPVCHGCPLQGLSD